jgi:hypothetical protein
VNINKAIKLLLSSLFLILPTYNSILGENNPPHNPPLYQPPVAENGSSRGEISKKTNRPKDVYVKSYTRKDGTRVRAHYRSKRK